MSEWDQYCEILRTECSDEVRASMLYATTNSMYHDLRIAQDLDGFCNKLQVTDVNDAPTCSLKGIAVSSILFHCKEQSVSSRHNVLSQLNLFDSEFNMELLTWSVGGGQYWYDNKPTCVQFSETETDACDRNSYICAGANGDDVGSLAAQAQFVLEALRTTGGAHTGCPAIAPLCTDDLHQKLATLAPSECTHLFGDFVTGEFNHDDMCVCLSAAYI